MFRNYIIVVVLSIVTKEPRDLVTSFIDDMLNQDVTTLSIMSNYFDRFGAEGDETKPKLDSLIKVGLQDLRLDLIQQVASGKRVKIVSNSQRPELFEDIVLGQDPGDSFILLLGEEVYRYIYVEKNKIRSMTLMKKGNRFYFLLY